MKKDFYKVLGVNQKASREKIKRAYRQAAKRYHPDVSLETKKNSGKSKKPTKPFPILRRRRFMIERS